MGERRIKGNVSPLHAVDLPLQIAVLQLANRVNARALEEQIGNQEAAEMSRVGDAAGSSQGSVKRDCADDENEVLRGDRKHDVVDESIGEVEPVSQQKAVDRAGRADDDLMVELAGELER